jgi:hypothetical protein
MVADHQGGGHQSRMRIGYGAGDLPLMGIAAMGQRPTRFARVPPKHRKAR